jgi:TPP-dependent pyruvate/acetoin dehydrogenase alpha subunit
LKATLPHCHSRKFQRALQRKARLDLREGEGRKTIEERDTMDKEQLLKAYRQMLTLRHLDEMLLDLKMKDLVMDGFHPYSGEEAVAVGVGTVLRPDDAVLSTHRPQGHSYVKGSIPRQIFAEMLGRRGGMSQGIGGPMQWVDAPNRFYCGSIVGSGVPVATGIALAFKRASQGSLAVCFFGDGASNTGAFHEGLNLAAIWKLPVLFVCENNQYGEAMPVREFVSANPIAKRAAAYGLEGVTVDVMDVEAVAAAAEKAAAAVRAGGGPAFIEAVTYRFRGHYGGDPEHTYRTREEVAEWRKKDPIPRCRASLLRAGAREADLYALDKQVTQELEMDQAWALQQPFPTVEQATDHVMIPLEQEARNG